MAKLTPDGVQESDEIYLLSSVDDNVKIRDALMDVKVLREVNMDGLEQWVPDIRVERIPGASHWVQIDAAERVNELLIDFLRS